MAENEKRCPTKMQSISQNFCCGSRYIFGCSYFHRELEWEISDPRYSKSWKIPITSAHTMNSRHSWHIFIQSKMECILAISHEIAATLLFTNSQVRLQKWFDLIVQGTSTGSRSSRSVNFSKELRKAFQ